MKRAEKQCRAEEDEAIRLYSTMPIAELQALVDPVNDHSLKCECCYLCIGHIGCLADHPPPLYCTSPRHHYYWRTRERNERMLLNGPFCLRCGQTIQNAVRDQVVCHECGAGH